MKCNIQNVADCSLLSSAAQLHPKQPHVEYCASANCAPTSRNIISVKHCFSKIQEPHLLFPISKLQSDAMYPQDYNSIQLSSILQAVHFSQSNSITFQVFQDSWQHCQHDRQLTQKAENCLWISSVLTETGCKFSRLEVTILGQLKIDQIGRGLVT